MRIMNGMCLLFLASINISNINSPIISNNNSMSSPELIISYYDKIRKYVCYLCVNLVKKK